MSNIALRGFVVVLTLLPCAAGAQSPPADALVRSFALPPLEELQATRERPLFSPRRRPDVESAAIETPVVEENPEALPFELTGVVMGEDTAVAILRNRETQETVHLRQGETVDAWSIEEIESHHIVLRQEDRQMRLELFPPKPEDSEESASAPPPPPPRQGTRRNLQNMEMQRRNSQIAPSHRRALRPGQRRRPQNE